MLKIMILKRRNQFYGDLKMTKIYIVERCSGSGWEDVYESIEGIFKSYKEAEDHAIMLNKKYSRYTKDDYSHMRITECYLKMPYEKKDKKLLNKTSYHFIC